MSLFPQYLKPVSSRLWALVLVVFCTILVQFPALAAEPITEVDVFGRGNVPNYSWAANGIYITLNTNGVVTDSYSSSPASILTNGVGPFVSTKTNLPGNPGTVTSTFTLSGMEEVSPSPGEVYFVRHMATITISVNTNSGAVTATGSDGDGYWFGGGNATLVSNGNSVSGGSGNFRLSTVVDISQRTVSSCVTMANGLQVCTDVFLLNPKPAPPPADAGAIAARNAARDALLGSNFETAFKLWTNQLTDVMLYQLPLIGEMLDAKHQLETQRILGEVAAESHRDYAPSEQVCAFGTLARSTVPSKYKVDNNIAVLNTIMQKRELLNAYTASSWGPASDFISRMTRYKNLYCDKNDSGGQVGVAGICAAPQSVRQGKDIGYRRTMTDKLTLDVDFTDTALTPDEEDILALGKNLYDNKVLTAIPERTIAPYGKPDILQDARMLSAVRSVARTSFATAAAMRSTGSGLNATQLQQVMQNLGVPAADVVNLVGANPSYFAQMEMITQKMYQDPNFYTNLYDNPANVARMKVVLQSVRLMADRDKFEQMLRKEMLISMLLEMRLREAQDTLKNKTTLSRGSN